MGRSIHGAAGSLLRPPQREAGWNIGGRRALSLPFTMAATRDRGLPEGAHFF